MTPDVPSLPDFQPHQVNVKATNRPTTKAGPRAHTNVRARPLNLAKQNTEHVSVIDTYTDSEIKKPGGRTNSRTGAGK
jgi:hypothetical protein